MTRRPSSRRRRHAALAALGVTLAAAVPAGPVQGQGLGDQGYDFATLHSLADGVTVDFNLRGFLPIEDLVGLASITSETHFGVGRSSSLAALPDPGDLILTLPGTLSALAGIPGLPDYPAAASADHPGRPVEDVQAAPDAGLGAGRLHAEASETGASAFAHVGHQVDTVGLVPSFSIGSVRTTARSTQVNPVTLEAIATTTVSDVKLLGGLLSISQITSEVAVEIVDDVPKATASDVRVSGVTLAGTPVGITEEGIVGLGSAGALAPVIDVLAKPLADQGIRVRTTPSSTAAKDRTAVASGGVLEIEVPLAVQGYPGVLTLTVGRALAELEVGALSTGVETPIDAGGGVGGGLPSEGATVSPILTGSPVGEAVTPRTPVAVPSGATAAEGFEVVAVPVARSVADWDVLALYRALLLGGLCLFAAGRVVIRSTGRTKRRPDDVRELWRW
jgi:hypothetical protein